MSAPLLSVALPVRNGANFLAEALDSILAQTMGDFVLHVSDNASTDATPDILANYARRDARVQVSRSPDSLSQVANTNRAVGLTDTRWVKLFCHDDLMRADCLAQLAETITGLGDSKVALIGNGEQHLFDNGHLTDPVPDGPPRFMSGRTALRARFSGRASDCGVPSITTATVRRDVFLDQGGFDGRYVYFEIFRWYELLVDWDFGYVPASLTVNRIHGRQVAADARGSLRSAQDHRLFVSELLARHGATLGFGWRSRAFARLIPLGCAATEIATEIRLGQAWRVPHMLSQMPLAWLPLIGPLVVRAWRAESRRTAALRGKVPTALIYP